MRSGRRVVCFRGGLWASPFPFGSLKTPSPVLHGPKGWSRSRIRGPRRRLSRNSPAETTPVIYDLGNLQREGKERPGDVKISSVYRFKGDPNGVKQALPLLLS